MHWVEHCIHVWQPTDSMFNLSISVVDNAPNATFPWTSQVLMYLFYPSMVMLWLVKLKASECVYMPGRVWRTCCKLQHRHRVVDVMGLDKRLDWQAYIHVWTLHLKHSFSRVGSTFKNVVVRLTVGFSPSSSHSCGGIVNHQLAWIVLVVAYLTWKSAIEHLFHKRLRWQTWLKNVGTRVAGICIWLPEAFYFFHPCDLLGQGSD